MKDLWTQYYNINQKMPWMKPHYIRITAEKIFPDVNLFVDRDGRKYVSKWSKINRRYEFFTID